MEEQFLCELHWCIDQLELGLETQNPGSRQLRETEKALKILRSRNAPVVKKRTVMRNIFGDYRQKIKDQEKKSAAKLRNSKMMPVLVTNAKSTFYRKSKHQLQPDIRPESSTKCDTDTSTHSMLNSDNRSESKDVEETNAEDQVTEKLQNFSFVPSDNTFQFGFKIENPSSVCSENLMTDEERDIKQNRLLEGEATKTFKFEKSNNNFRFCFDDPS